MTLVSRLSTLLIVLLLVGCSQEKVQVIEGPIYGTTYSIQFTEDVDKEETHKLVKAELDRIDMVFSTYKEGTEIQEINAGIRECITKTLNSLQDIPFLTDDGELWQWNGKEEIPNDIWKSIIYFHLEICSFPIKSGEQLLLQALYTIEQIDKEIYEVEFTSEEMADLFDRSNKISELSLNGFKPFKTTELDLNSMKINKKINIREYDFSAIAKGHAVDKIGELLAKNGIFNYFIDIGGEISINGTKFNKAWTWGINNPFNLNSDAYRAFKAPESGISIATSGEYRNPDHIWGEGPEDAASVTVIANNTAEADAWATAIYALGIEEGLKVAERNGLAVFLIKEDGKTIESTMWGLKTFHPEQILEEIKEQIE